MLPKHEYYKGKDVDCLNVVLHGSSSGMESDFNKAIFDKAKTKGDSVVVFNFPYIDRGEEKLMNSGRDEEVSAIADIVERFGGKYKKIRLIGKSLGAVIGFDYLRRLSEKEKKRYEVVVLGYDLGWIDISGFSGKVTVIQGGRDPYGDIEDIFNDLNDKQMVELWEVGGADHSFRVPETKEPRYVEDVLKLLFKEKVEKEKPGGNVSRLERSERMVQEFDFDCGAACVGTLMYALGKKYGIEELRKKLGTSVEIGTDPQKIVGFLKEEGVDYLQGRNISFGDLQRLVNEGYTCLLTYQAWWSEEEKDQLLCGHYSLVLEVDDEYVWLIDPGVNKEVELGKGEGVVKKERRDFDRRWIDRSEAGEIYDHWLIAVKL